MQSVEEQLYRDYINDVISRGSVPELLSIWRDSLALASTGQAIRELITRQLIDIGKIHKMVVQEGITFQEFVSAYRIHLIELRSRKGLQKTTLAYAREGNWEAVFYLLDKIHAKDALEAESILQNCVEIYSANQDLTHAQVEEFLKSIEKYKSEHEICFSDNILVGAVAANNQALIEWCLELPSVHVFCWRRALCKAIETKQEKWISFFLEKGYGDPYFVLQEAAAVNNLQVMEYVLAFEEDGELFDHGLRGAVQGGNLELVEKFLALGANARYGFDSAGKSGQLEMAKFLVKKGTVNWLWFVEQAVMNNHVHMVEYFFEAAPEQEKRTYNGCWKMLFCLKVTR